MLTEPEWNAVVTSLKVATASVALGLPFAIGLGYFLARWRSAGKWIVETVVNLPLVLPPVVTGYLLLLLMGRNGPLGRLLDEFLGWRVVFTWYAAVAAGAIVSFPLMVRTIRVSFRSVDTRLEEAARSLGRSRLSTFYRVSLPLALRGIVAGSVLGFARTLGEFGATIMVAGNIPGQTQTIPTAIYSLVQSPGGWDRSKRLLLVSILLACVTLAASEILERRRERHELS
ncbi:MAG: molybdate ABC transporter permease subunit [Acidobacteriota bacterium]|nr:molybdate ABC transporter permease subunit [Acidobacteriota bacterium]